MSRIDIFKQMLETDPANSNVLFGLAKEYEKAGENEELIELFSIDISQPRTMKAMLTECWRQHTNALVALRRPKRSTSAALR